MPHRPLITSADLASLIADGGSTWRHTALTAALVRIYGCSERTARRSISQARAAGIIKTTGGVYEVARPDPTSKPPAHPRARPIAGSHITNSTGRRHHVDRRKFLELLRRAPMTYTELTAATCTRFGCSPTTARDNLTTAKRYGYVEKVAGRYQLTQDGERGLDSFGRLTGREGVRFARFCSGRPGLFLEAAPPSGARHS